MKNLLLFLVVVGVSSFCLANGCGKSIESNQRDDFGALHTIKCSSPLEDFTWYFDYNPSKMGEQHTYSIDPNTGKYTNYKVYLDSDVPNGWTLKGMSNIDMIYAIIPAEKKPFSLYMIRAGVVASLICNR